VELIAQKIEVFVEAFRQRSYPRLVLRAWQLEQPREFLLTLALLALGLLFGFLVGLLLRTLLTFLLSPCVSALPLDAVLTLSLLGFCFALFLLVGSNLRFNHLF
jgi:hypothetical protein